MRMMPQHEVDYLRAALHGGGLAEVPVGEGEDEGVDERVGQQHVDGAVDALDALLAGHGGGLGVGAQGRAHPVRQV